MTTAMYDDMCFDLTDAKIALMQSTQECDAALAGLGRRHTSHCGAIAILLPGHPCPMRPDVERQILLLQERRNVLVTNGGAGVGGSGSGNAGGGHELELVPIGRENPAPDAPPTTALDPKKPDRLSNQRLLTQRTRHAEDNDDDDDDGGGSSGSAPPPRPRG